MAEAWRPVVEYEGWYEVSDHGRVRRIKAAGGTRVGLILTASLDSYGYPTVGLNRDGTRRSRSLHRIVAEAWLAPRPPRVEVNHRDGDKLNNTPPNLEWVAHSANMRHAAVHKLMRSPSGERNGKAKLTEQSVRDIRASRGSVTHARLAHRHCVSDATIHAVQARLVWRHVV